MNNIVNFFINKIFKKINYILRQIEFLIQHPNGYVIITETSQFEVPYGVSTIYISAIGGGGGGGAGGRGSTASSYTGYGGGGGSGGHGQTVFDEPINVTAGEILNVIIGDGGTGGIAPSNGGGDGTVTQLLRQNTVLVTASYGTAGGGGGMKSSGTADGGIGGIEDGNDGDTGTAESGGHHGTGGAKAVPDSFGGYGSGGAGGDGGKPVGGQQDGQNGENGDNGALVICYGAGIRYANVQWESEYE